MFTQERLQEISDSPREAYIAKVEAMALVDAYKSRIVGLSVTRGADGTWLHFESPDGSKASISIGCMSAERGPVTGGVILKWADALAVPNA